MNKRGYRVLGLTVGCFLLLATTAERVIAWPCTTCDPCYTCTPTGCEYECGGGTCCNGSCCSNACCDNVCCDAGVTCCDGGGGCCSNACCNDVCCGAGVTCCDGGGDCCTNICCNDVCCGAGVTCCDGGGDCCTNVCCNDVCCGAGKICCNGTCCDSEDCCGDECCKASETCCNGECCNNYSGICCDDTKCCDWTIGEVCCDGKCCEPECCDSWDCEHCVGGSCEPCLEKPSDYEELTECSGTIVFDPDWTPNPNGCSSPFGDNPAGGLCGETSSFLNACNAHDTCYQTCGSSRISECDAQFSSDLAAVCEPFSGDCEYLCDYWAENYAGAVILWGEAAWEDGQVNSCACCNCD